MAAADPSSDWNAPVEHWGNYEEPPVLVTPAPVQKEQPVPNKVFFFVFFSFNSGFLLYCFYYRLHINWSACLIVASGVGGWEGHRGSVRRRSQIEKEEEKEEENRRGGCIWRSGNKPNQADKIRSSSEYLTCCNIIISWVVDGEHGARSQHNTQTPRASCTALQKAECQHILHSE